MKNFTLEAKKIIDMFIKAIAKQQGCKSCYVSEYDINQTLSSFNTLIKEHTLTKEEFRNILCEFPPSIAKDSGQPEWTTGEMNRVWDFITGKKKWIFK